MNKRIFLSLAHPGGSEMDFIRNALSSNWITSDGPNVEGFEEDLEHYFDKKVHITALNSGTAAIHLGLILLDVKAGDEVICQSLTFAASANPILYLGASPVFVDSESETWNICPIALEEAILDAISKGKKPKAIITVHLYGMPYKVEAVRAVADKYQIPILEDSAEAFGSTYKGQKCGTFGDIGIVSFNGNKIITTSGGGILISKQKEVKTKAVFLSTQARDNTPYYQHSEIGYNYRMSNICAGIGRGQMLFLPEYIELRRKMHHFYEELFSSIDGVAILNEPHPDYHSNHWLSAIVVDPSETKNNRTAEDLRLFLESQNIESRPVWKPMHLQPIFEKYPYYGGVIAEVLFEKGLCLPSGSNLTNQDRDRLERAIREFF